MKIIASIYPVDRFESRPRWRPVNQFHIPAAGNDRVPVLLKIESQECSEYIGNNVTTDKKIHDFEIAPDLVHVWTNVQYSAPDARPGIWIVDIPGVEDPTPEQVMKTDAYKENLEAQNRFFDKLVRMGDRLAAESKKDQLLRLHYVACDWLQQTRNWNEDYRAENLKHCQFCGKNIYRMAVKCSECGEVVDFEEYARLQAEKDAAVKSAMAGVKLPPPLNPTQPKAQARA